MVGFDDIPAAGLANPPLTTIAQNTRLAGEVLVETLLRQIRNEPAQGAGAANAPGRAALMRRERAVPGRRRILRRVQPPLQVAGRRRHAAPTLSANCSMAILASAHGSNERERHLSEGGK